MASSPPSPLPFTLSFSIAHRTLFPSLITTPDHVISRREFAYTPLVLLIVSPFHSLPSPLSLRLSPSLQLALSLSDSSLQMGQHPRGKGAATAASRAKEEGGGMKKRKAVRILLCQQEPVRTGEVRLFVYFPFY